MKLRSLFGGRGRARAEREAAARLAALEAGEDDPLFAPDVVTDRASALFVAIQRAWSVNDVGTLREMVGADLLREWEARLTDFRRKGWRNQVDVLDGPEVRYIGVVNRAADDDDRVVVQLTARLRDVVVDRHGAIIPSDDGEVTQIREFWTLGKRAHEWVVVSIEQEREGRHHLSEPLVPTSDSDDVRLRAEAVMELASADSVPAARVGELLSPEFSGTARAAAQDLSLADGRFAPDVLATAIGEVIELWDRAIDGPDEPLAACTTPHALQRLLYPTGNRQNRLVIRGAQVQAVTIIAVTPAAPPEVRVQVDVEGIQYIEDRSTTEIVAGSKKRRTTARQVWTLRLSDDQRRPWSVSDADGVIPS